MGGLLADDHRFGQQRGEALGQHQLGLAVGHGDHVVRRLGDHLVGGEGLVARQDRGAEGAAHHRLDPQGERPAHER